jgi:5-oxoprolinase (ATP-hydrolysing)
VREFGIRHGSGGAGKWRGGAGVVRELEVLEGMQVSILSEVRMAVTAVPAGRRTC